MGYVTLDSHTLFPGLHARTILGLHPSSDGNDSAWGQSWQFTTGDDAYKLYQAKFYLRRTGVIGGTIRAVLYASTGTHGTNAKPTGSALAESDTLATSLISTTEYGWFTFSFPSPLYEVAKNTVYCIELQSVTGTYDGSHYVRVSTTLTTIEGDLHAGNGSYFDNSIWRVGTPGKTSDITFEVIGEEIPVVAKKLVGDGLACVVT